MTAANFKVCRDSMGAEVDQDLSHATVTTAGPI